LEAGRWLFAKSCEFVAGVADMAGLPGATLPEVAFAGRSNVGKSSLINALTGRRTLARTSQTPGRTRQLNFFDLGGRLALVDLPGYGYARASKSDIKAWTTLVLDYLRGRPALRRVCILIDARRGIVDADRKVMAMLDEAAVSYVGVLTKADKLTAAALDDIIETTLAELVRRPAAHPALAVTSAAKGAGIADLRAWLAPLAEAA
jgi:GTP-binding protein